MKSLTIGEVLFLLRTHHQIKREDLCRGICSPRTEERIEAGMQNGEKWITERLFGRMGRSTDNIEYFLGEKAFHLQEMRMRIKQVYDAKDKEKMKGLLEEYAKQNGTGGTLHQQFILKMSTLLCEVGEDVEKEKQQLLERAVLCTVPCFQSENLEDLYLSEEEIELIVLLAESYEESKNIYESLSLKKRCFQYLQQERISEEMQIKCLPALAVSLAAQAMRIRDREIIKEVCGKTIEILKKNRILFGMADLMIYRAEVMKNETCSEEEVRFYKKELQYASVLMEIMDEYWQSDEITRKDGMPETEGGLSVIREQSECHLIGKDIRSRRKAKKMTQLDLTQKEELCTVRQLLNIESGKSKPDEKLYCAIMKQLGVDKTFHECYVNVSNFSLDERRFQMERCIEQMKYQEAEDLLNELKEEPAEGRADLQYQLFHKTVMDVNLHQMDYNIAIKMFEKALSYSLENYKKQNLVVWSLSRCEVKLLNNIATTYARAGDLKAAVRIFLQLKENYERREVGIHHHLRLYMVILHNLEKIFELQGKYGSAIAICNLAIHLCVRSGKGESRRDMGE